MKFLMLQSGDTIILDPIEMEPLEIYMLWDEEHELFCALSTAHPDLCGHGRSGRAALIDLVEQLTETSVLAPPWDGAPESVITVWPENPTQTPTRTPVLGHTGSQRGRNGQ